MGAITAGPVTDFVSQWHARRHGGMFIPESRLIVLVLPAMMTMVGQLLFGFGAERHLHYIVIFVGFGIINYVVSSITGLAIIYAMDSYHAVAAEAVAMLNGFKSMFAFGFSYAIVPWVETSGYAKVSSQQTERVYCLSFTDAA
ncbi:MFS general substrate transporter [Ilyonectria robusta]